MPEQTTPQYIQQLLERTRRSIDAIIYQGLRDRLGADAIQRKLTEFFGQQSLLPLLTERFRTDAQQAVQDAAERARNRYNFVSSNTLSYTSLSGLAGVFDKTLADVATIQGKLHEGVLRELQDNITAGKTAAHITARIKSVANIGLHRAATIANTGLAAFDVSARMDIAQSAGIKKVEYAGPSAERPKCKEWLGKQFTFAEVGRLNNGQGLPVLQYRGGYNCRHDWEEVIE